MCRRLSRLFRRRSDRIRDSKAKTQDSHARGEHIDRQWPEVHALSAWARETRERNHLTQLFIDSRGGK